MEPGPASRSYGLQVAALAGIPATVLEQAREILKTLEALRQDDTDTALGGQLGLFSSPSTPSSTAKLPSEPHCAAATPSLERALRAIDPDELSPREALDALYELRRLLDDGD